VEPDDPEKKNKTEPWNINDRPKVEARGIVL